MCYSFDAMKQLLLATLLTLTLSSVSAEPMQCGDNLVSPDDTKAQVIERCGEPTSREGETWTYQHQNEIPKIITFGRGVVMFIEDGQLKGFENTSPLGDHP